MPPTTARKERDNPRHVETERLLRLMGGMLADAYVDACAILTEEPSHRTASHLVSHLAREIESGVRQLLYSMLPAARQAYLQGLPRERPDSRDPPRSAVIDEICTFLRVVEDTDARRLWRRAEWHGRAHRDALHVPRELDAKFVQRWNDFSYLLLVLGQAFEASYLNATPAIDVLAATVAPTDDDRQRLTNQIPQSPVALDRFFSKAGAGWFSQLRRTRYFKSADPLNPDADGLVSYVVWPPGPYLVRIAADRLLAEAVVTIFEGLQTDNPQATESAADVALIVAPTLAGRLAPRIAEYLGSRAQWVLPMKAAKVVVRLAAESQTQAAMVIASALLPVPERRSSRLIRLADIAPAYANLGLDVVRLFADRLHAADQDPGPGGMLAYSRLWRPSIARDGHRDDRDAMVTGLREAGCAVAAQEGAAAVIAILDEYPQRIFARLALHLLAVHPEPDLVEERLMSPQNFADDEVEPEYTELLRQQFQNLPGPVRETIMELIEAEPSPDRGGEYRERRRLQRIARLGDAMPENYRDEYAELVGRYGAPVPHDAEQVFTEWPGNQSPHTSTELLAMPDDDLVTFLATWTEPGGWRAPTTEGLRIQLQEAVATDPERFSAMAPRLAELNPTYASGVVAALTRLLENPRSGSAPQKIVIAWDALLDFAETITATTVDPSGNQAPDPTWAGCRRHIARLVIAAMQNEMIYSGLSDRLLGLILRLADDPDPSPAATDVSTDYDPTEHATDSVRPLALTAAVRFIAWEGVGDDGSENLHHQTVIELLAAHLDEQVDASPAVRSVYGRNLNILLMHLPEWTALRRDQILGTGNLDESDLGETAWQSFLRSNRPSRPAFELLSARYGKAATSITMDTSMYSQTPGAEANERLLQHIAMYYMWGLVTLDDEPITAVFAPTTPIEARARFLQFCGEMISDTSEDLPDVAQRLQQLWDWRDRELAGGRTSPQEFGGVGWWLSSKIFPVDWTLERLRRVLAAGGAPVADHLVAQRLAELADDHTAQTVACVSLLIEVPTDRWFIDGSREELATVLTAGVNASDPGVRQTAAATINRLVARGRAAFARILE